jgi:hypothetical protein
VSPSKLNVLRAPVLLLALTLCVLKSASAATAYDQARAACEYLDRTHMTQQYAECMREQTQVRYSPPKGPVYVIQQPPYNPPPKWQPPLRTTH